MVPDDRFDDGFDDDSAVRACAQGDRIALRRLYERHAARLLGVALRIVRDRALAEDVLQDAFLQIWRGASTFDAAQGSARGWMFTVVRHRAIHELRRRGRDPVVATEHIAEIADAVHAAESLAEHSSAQHSASDIDPFDAARRAGAIDDCLRQLDTTQRECIVFAYVEGMSHSEIAERVATPLGTVKSWIRRGLLSLRRCLT